MLKIILIRHGEEEKKKSNDAEYQTNDSVLTPKGIKQVKKLAQRLRSEKIEEIYSSDIKRALQTAKIISKEIGVDIKIDKRIRERNVGEFEKLGDNWRKAFNELKEKELANGIPLKDIKPPGGENLYGFRERIKSFMKELSNKKGDILVSAHGGVNMAIINFAQDWNTLEFKPIKQDPACINILSFDDNKWNVISINDTKHLNN